MAAIRPSAEYNQLPPGFGGGYRGGGAGTGGNFGGGGAPAPAMPRPFIPPARPLPGSNNIVRFEPPKPTTPTVPAPNLPQIPGKPSIPAPFSLNPFDLTVPRVNPLYPLFGPPTFAPGEWLFSPAREPDYGPTLTIIGFDPSYASKYAIGNLGVDVGRVQQFGGAMNDFSNIQTIFYDPPRLANLIANHPDEISYKISEIFEILDKYGNSSKLLWPKAVSFAYGVNPRPNPVINNEGKSATFAPAQSPPIAPPDPQIPAPTPPTFPTVPGETPEIVPFKRRAVPATPVTPDVPQPQPEPEPTPAPVPTPEPPAEPELPPSDPAAPEPEPEPEPEPQPLKPTPTPNPTPAPDKAPPPQESPPVEPEPRTPAPAPKPIVDPVPNFLPPLVPASIPVPTPTPVPAPAQPPTPTPDTPTLPSPTKPPTPAQPQPEPKPVPDPGTPQPQPDPAQPQPQPQPQPDPNAPTTNPNTNPEVVPGSVPIPAPGQPPAQPPGQPQPTPKAPLSIPSAPGYTPSSNPQSPLPIAPGTPPPPTTSVLPPSQSPTPPTIPTPPVPPGTSITVPKPVNIDDFVPVPDPPPDPDPDPDDPCADDPCQQQISQSILPVSTAIKTFIGCENDAPIFGTEVIAVPANAVDYVSKIFERLSNIEGQKCSDCDCVATVPEWWEVRFEGGIPQLILSYREVLPDGTLDKQWYPVCIPHPVSLEPTENRLTTGYRKGNYQILCVLDDNSKIILNAATEQIGVDFLENQILPLVDPSFKTKAKTKISHFPKNGFKQRDVVLWNIDFYELGNRITRPTWRRRVKN